MACNTISAGTGELCRKAGGIEKLYLATVPTDLAITPTRTAGGKVTDIDDGATALVFYEFDIEAGTGFFKENTVGDIALGFEKTCGGQIQGYTDAMNVILDPVLRGKSIAIAKDNNGSYFLQGDLNGLKSVPAEHGILEGIDGNNGYMISLIAKDGLPMREIDATKIIQGTGSITVNTTV